MVVFFEKYFIPDWQKKTLWLSKVSLWELLTCHTVFFTFINTQKRAPSNFPGLLGIYRNPNWKEFFKSRESFLRKVKVCALTDLNPGFGRPWKKLWILFVYGTFIMTQKKSFGQFFILNSCTGSKVPFWQFFHSAKMALLNPCMKFKFFFARDFFCVIMKVPYTMVQGLPNPGLRSVKVQTETFLKKDSQNLKNSF